MSAGGRGYCSVIDGHVRGTLEQQDGGWCAAVGKVHASEPLARAPIDTLDGHFAAVRYDEADDRLQVLNDPFGIQALYVSDCGDRSYVSTCATALARHLGAVPDPLGAALFLRTGRQFGPVTHWQGIRRLDPATLVSFTGAKPTTTTYWRPSIDQRVRSMSLQETADFCAYTLLSTIERYLHGEPCVIADLTGGFDSRLVAAALVRLGIPFTAQTSGESETVDVRLAREVARAGGIEWHQEELSPDWRPCREALWSALGWGDGSLEILQLSQVLWRQRLRAHSCGLLLTGGGGEHFSPQPWIQELWRAGWSRRINFDNLMSLRALTPVDLSMLRAEPRHQVEQYAREVLGQSATYLSGELNTTQLDVVFVHHRGVGHFGAYRSAAEAFIRSDLPFYYKDVFTAGFSARHRVRNGHRLRRAVIGRISPKIGAVQTERGGPAQSLHVRNAHRFAPYYWRLGRTALRKVRGRPNQAPSEGPAEAGYRHAVRVLREEGALDPRTMRSGDLYDPHALERLVARVEQPKFSAWSVVGRILTLELSLRSVDGACLTTLRA